MAEPHAEVPVDDPEDRRQSEHDEEQRPIRPRHHHRREKHLARLNGADEQHVLDADAQGLHVARHPADDAPEFHAMEEAHRLPLRLREDLGPQPVHHRLADLERIALPEVEEPVGREREHRIPEHAEPQRRDFAVRDRTLDDERGNPDKPGQLRRADHRQDAERDDLGPHRRGVGEEPADQRPLERPLDLAFLVVIAHAAHEPEVAHFRQGGDRPLHAPPSRSLSCCNSRLSTSCRLATCR